jgi:hypothetical protein
MIKNIVYYRYRLPRFPPKTTVTNMAGLLTQLHQSLNLPVSLQWHIKRPQLYSSGGCIGFTPISLLILVKETIDVMLFNSSTV